MGKSMLTIHKEIQKKIYAESDLGKLERKISDFYQDLLRNKRKLPESVAKQVYDIRDENERKQMAYIKESEKRDREAVDAMLLESMTKEWEVLEANKSTTENE